MANSDQQNIVFVTGATGFVGSHVVDRLLESERTVRCLVRRSSNLRYLKDPRIQFAYGGLDNATDWDAALDGVDTIYHVAGTTFARRARDYFDTNQHGTESILAAALKRRAQLKKFVLVSSLAAIGPSRDGKPVDEETPPAPITPYGKSKLMGEEAVRAIGDLLPWTIVRPPAVYGPRDYALLEMFKSISRGLMPMVGRYDKRVSLVHVHDLADGIILAGESDRSTGRAYFISSDEIYSMQKLSLSIAEMLGRRARSIVIPRPLAFGVALAAEGIAAITRKPPVINRDKVRDFSERCWGCSIERAKHGLGYHPQISIQDGLRGTIDWYKREELAVNERREEVVAKREDAEARRKDNTAGVEGETATLRSQTWLYPADKIVIAYLTIIAALVITFSFRIPVWLELTAAHLLVIALILVLTKWSQSVSRRASAVLSSGGKSSRLSMANISQFIHGWYPVALIPTTYKELSYLIPLIHPHDFDIELAAIDHRLFGIPPTVWLERFTWPPVTEVLQIIYGTYYFLPIILGAVLWRKGWFEQYKFWVFVVALGFYVSYLGYIAIPATGPRFLPAIKEAQSFPLTGVWLFQSLRESLDRAEGITRDCFPSGHTELTLIVLYYARRFHRPTFWWMLPIGTALILSTVYLRYHYVVDVIAGAAAATLVILIAGPLYRVLAQGLETRG